MPDKVTTVGYIGLGMMGKPMAKNLLRAGYPLVVHNRSSPSVEELVATGAANGGSPKGVAERADIIMMCLPDTPDVQLVVDGPNGVLSGISPGKVVVDMSTSSPLLARVLAAKTEQLGAAMLDAPVSGGDVGAEDATLAIMVGGRREIFEQVKPVLEAVGKTIEYMGDSGAGQITKVCNQMVAMSTFEVVCEALVLALKAGLDPSQVRRVLMGGFGRSRILELHGQRLLDSDFKPGIELNTQIKDLRIILETGREVGSPVPSAELLNNLLSSSGFACGEVQ